MRLFRGDRSGLDWGRRGGWRRGDLHDLEVLDGLIEELCEADEAGRRHDDARVDRHERGAGAVGDDAGGEIEIDFFLADVDEGMVRVARREVVILDLNGEILLLRSRGGLFFRHRAQCVAATGKKSTGNLRGCAVKKGGEVFSARRGFAFPADGAKCAGNFHGHLHLRNHPEEKGREAAPV